MIGPGKRHRRQHDGNAAKATADPRSAGIEAESGVGSPSRFYASPAANSGTPHRASSSEERFALAVTVEADL